MRQIGLILAAARVCGIIFTLLLMGCRSEHQVNPRLAAGMPQKIVWAWERPENLTFLDPMEFGVAFLAQTIFLENAQVLPRPRHQPLDMAPGSYIIAVTRIETNKQESKRPTFSPEMVKAAATLIKATLDLPNVKGVQIDFDATISERDFYRRLLKEVKTLIPADSALTMTSLASWCTGDAWFNDFPVDEAVPMAFQMGSDEEKIKNYLRNGNDWKEPLCRGSYGLSIDDPLGVALKPGRRIYYFKNSAWKRSDLDGLK